MDYHILDAADGRSGLEVYRSRRIHCVVVEIALPDRSGFEVLRNVVPHASGPSVAVIVLTQRRTELGLSQRGLAKRVGVSDAYITQLETRERINPSLHVLKSLAKALKVTVAELVE